MENVILGLAIGFIIGTSMERCAERKRSREMAKAFWDGLRGPAKPQAKDDEPLEPGVTWLRPDKAHWSNN